jgi:hypothetical protein
LSHRSFIKKNIFFLFSFVHFVSLSLVKGLMMQRARPTKWRAALEVLDAPHVKINSRRNKQNDNRQAHKQKKTASRCHALNCLL